MGAFLLNILALFGKKRVLIWGAEQAVKATDTLLDDHGLDFIKGTLDGDLDDALLAAEKVIAILAEKKQADIAVAARGGVITGPTKKTGG